MKGILLAGGAGTRLHPMTRVLSKQLMPVYDKPMICYPLSTLMLAGIKEILLISTPQDLPLFERLLGDGSDLGLSLKYQEQAAPEGLAQALILAEKFLAGSPSCLVLGDNVFHGHGLPEMLVRGAQLKQGAQIFGYYVTDPHRYGIVEFDASMRAVGIEEKPAQAKSNYAVPGIYFYDARAPSFARSLKPSPRGELEITDLNLCYLREKTLKVEVMGRGLAWLDTGTPDSLLEAAQYISVLEKRQGLKVACLEEIAYRQKFIDKAQLKKLAAAYKANNYGKYLSKIADDTSVVL